MFVSWRLWSVIGLGSRMEMLIEVYTVESGVGKMANGSAGVTGVTSHFVLQYYSITVEPPPRLPIPPRSYPFQP